MIDMSESFVDYWDIQHADKTMIIQNWTEKEYKVTYKNSDNKKFTVIFKPKKYPIGFNWK